MSKHKIPKIIITEISEEDDERCYIPKRYIFTALSFFGIVNVYTMRVNLSVAMVAMVNSTTDISPNISESNLVECSNLLPSNHSSTPEKFVGEQYNWDAQQQGIILGAFFYFYIVTQLPGGVLAEKFGGKWLFGIGILNTAIFSLLTPLAAHWGAVPLIAVRIIQGFGEGMTVPAMNSVFSRWAPELERSRLSTIIYTGAQVGSVIAMPVSGWLCSTDLLGGWPSAFYVFGTISCLWFVLWTIFIHESPYKHPSISEKELKIFEKEKEQILEKPSTPWKSIFTSIPVWAVVLAHIGQNFGFLIFLTELPTYLSTILHFGIQNNGLLSALPYILQAVSAWIASYIADQLRTSGKLSITNIRKLCNSIGLFGPALCLLGVTVSGCRPELTVALFSLAMALNGFVYSGFNVTHVDMSPTFAGTLYAITNAFSNFCGVIGPAVVGAFTNKGATLSNWSDVFYITAAVYVFTGAFYAAFASAELQPWGYGEQILTEKTPVNNMQEERQKHGNKY